MKKIISLILAILGVGLLISCVNNKGFFSINNDNNNTSDNVTTKDNSTTNNHITTDNNSTVDNNTTDSDPDSNVQLYSHNVRVFYTSTTNDGEDYSDQILTFDFSFRFIIRFSEEVNGPIDLYNYSSEWLSIDSFDGTITYNSVLYNVTGIRCHEVGLTVCINHNGNDIDINLDSLDNSYSIFDSVSLYE